LPSPSLPAAAAALRRETAESHLLLSGREREDGGSVGGEGKGEGKDRKEETGKEVDEGGRADGRQKGKEMEAGEEEAERRQTGEGKRGRKKERVGKRRCGMKREDKPCTY
jgi:hypothetical protein